MDINKNTVKGKWREIKGDLQKAWGNLTDDELEKTKGDMKSISGLVQQRYGGVIDSYYQKVSDIFQKFEEKKDETIASVKNAIKK
jgi:uncharacterized protein YjbJ (UPF0337 family)